MYTFGKFPQFNIVQLQQSVIDFPTPDKTKSKLLSYNDDTYYRQTAWLSTENNVVTKEISLQKTPKKLHVYLHCIKSK